MVSLYTVEIGKGYQSGFIPSGELMLNISQHTDASSFGGPRGWDSYPFLGRSFLLSQIQAALATL